MKFDPESYSITIRKEDCDGEILYVGRVAEFPNISSFEETYEAAHALVIDSIITLKKIANEANAEFPLPYPALSDEFSGRVTLRLPRSLHAKVSMIATQEDISVNQYLVAAIATHVGEVDGIGRVVSEAGILLGQIVTDAMTKARAWRVATFMMCNTSTPVVSTPLAEYCGQRYFRSPALITGATFND